MIEARYALLDTLQTQLEEVLRSSNCLNFCVMHAFFYLTKNTLGMANKLI